MKKINLIACLLSMVFLCSLGAQTDTNFCGSQPDEAYLNICQNPESDLNQRINFLKQFPIEEIATFTRLNKNAGDYSVKERSSSSVADLPNLLPSERKVPIVAHIIRKSDGTGGLTEAQLNSAFSTTNAVYNQLNLDFFVYEIKYIDADSLFNFTFLHGDTNPEYDKMNMAQRNVNRKLNIYFVPKAQTSWANFPETSAREQHILMLNDHVGNGSTLTHEVGHWFDLLHTHETYRGADLVDGSNCSSSGDFVCDTPADPGLSGRVTTSCVYTGGASLTDANGEVYSPDTRNLMSYSHKPCRATFTNGQKYRIQAAFLGMEYSRGYTFSSSSASNIDVVYEVSFIPQNINVACWDASISMIIAWRDKYIFSPATVNQATNYWNQYYCSGGQSGGGLGAYDEESFRNFAMVAETPMSRNAQNLARLLEDYGPLWMASKTCATQNQDCLASKVITGIIGDGTPAGTRIMITDPNASAAESKEQTMTFKEFQAELSEIQTTGVGDGLEVYIAHLMTIVQ